MPAPGPGCHKRPRTAGKLGRVATVATQEKAAMVRTPARQFSEVARSDEELTLLARNQ